LANSWKLRLNHDYIITNARVNHFTFSVDNYLNRGANKTVSQGWNQKLGYAVVDFDTLVHVSPRNAFSIITANPCLFSGLKVIIIEPESLAIETSPT
jgi:hypothetical protein